MLMVSQMLGFYFSLNLTEIKQDLKSKRRKQPRNHKGECKIVSSMVLTIRRTFVSVAFFNSTPGCLKKEESKYFNSPRNIICVPNVLKKSTESAIVVLDNIGIHVFGETGDYIKYKLLLTVSSILGNFFH